MHGEARRIRGGRAGRVGALAALALLAGCGAQRENAASLALAECRLPRLATAARCTTLAVPEDRTRPQGRRIGIHVAVLPANTLTPRPDPLVLIAGGPGQAASQLAPFAARLVEVRRTRDVVLVDQRGTGRSSPLTCAAFAPEDDLRATLEADPVAKAHACAQELEAQGVDARHYTTAAWVADLEAVRVALGYPQLNLWGGSYGTRVALEYLRRYPDRVRSAILDGVAAPATNIAADVWAARERALDALVAACAESASCRATHPDLAATLARIEQSLGPTGHVVELADPRTGETRAVTLTFDAVLSGLQALLYAPERAVLIPDLLAQAAAGDYGPLVAAAQSVGGDLAEQINAALHYSVVCAEDATRVDSEARKALAATRSRSLVARMLAVCEVWPRGASDPAASESFASGVPVLVLSGSLDPVTPPANGEAVAKMLGRAHHVVAAGYGHIVSPHACGPQLVGAFVAAPDFDRLPAKCVEHFRRGSRVPLWANRLGPQP
jgi:pimeloyl-ACP methyl ester carboxylesterase